jgi:hypothetical protein
MVEMTISTARTTWATDIFGKGSYCPCCDRFGKVYKTRISGVMAKALLWMASKHEAEWVSMPERAPRWITRSNSFNKLKNWGLVIPLPMPNNIEDKQKKKSSGYWKVTSNGMKFAKGLVQVPKYVYLYNDAVIKVSTETVYIQDCFGKKFNYAEVMQEAWGREY